MFNIPLSKPSYLAFTDDVKREVCKVIDSGHIAQGKKVEEFEQLVAQYVGTKYAIAVSSGTAGLFLCLKAVGIGEGDEVITTPFSFIASTNVILHAEARPVFVDIDRDTYNMSVPEAIYANGKRTKAVLPVDVFGNPIDTSGLPNDTYTILDSCESFGSKMARPFDACVYAFYPNKQITTGEGGIICTDDKGITDYCRAARNQGRVPGSTWLEHDILGYNFRMTDIQAAIGIEQVKRIEEIKEKRSNVMLRYLVNLGNLFVNDYIGMQGDTPALDRETNPFVFTIKVPNRDKVMQYMLDAGIEVKPYFPCIHLQPCMSHLGYKKGDFPVAEEVSSRTLALPFWTDMAEGEVDEVCETLKKALEVCND